MYMKGEEIVDVLKKDGRKVGRSGWMNVEIGWMEGLDKFVDEERKEGKFRGCME